MGSGAKGVRGEAAVPVVGGGVVRDDFGDRNPLEEAAIESLLVNDQYGKVLVFRTERLLRMFV